MRPLEIKRKYKISHTTLLSLEEEGKLNSYKTQGGHRRYEKKDIESIFKSKHDDKLILCQMQLYFDTWEELPDEIKIVGMADGNDRCAIGYLVDEPLLKEDEPLSFMGVGTYKKHIPDHVGNHFIFRNDCRLPRIAHRTVVLKGENRSPYIGRVNTQTGYCDFEKKEDGTIWLLVSNLHRYLNSDFNTSWELPGYFMAQEVDKADKNSVVIRQVTYQYEGIK